MTWRERAEMDCTDARVLGEDEHGDLWVPSRSRSGWWDRRFQPSRPTHWPAYIRSRARRRVAMIETGLGQ